MEKSYKMQQRSCLAWLRRSILPLMAVSVVEFQVWGYKKFHNRCCIMPCPFAGPKMFCAGPIFCARPKRWFTFSKIGFGADTKVFEEALNPVKFLGWLKKFGSEENILRPVKGQGISFWIEHNFLYMVQKAKFPVKYVVRTMFWSKKFCFTPIKFDQSKSILDVLL